MAYRDYIHCCVCDDKLIYDGYDQIRDQLEDSYGADYEMVCPSCRKTEMRQHDEARAEVERLTKIVAEFVCQHKTEDLQRGLQNPCLCDGCRMAREQLIGESVTNAAARMAKEAKEDESA